MWVVQALGVAVVLALFLSMVSQPPPASDEAGRNRNITRRSATGSLDWL